MLNNESILNTSIIRNSWSCFALILKVAGLDILQLRTQENKLPEDIARECGYEQMFIYIVQAFQSGLDIIDPEFVISITKSGNQVKTLVVTDERCIDHAGFENYSNIIKRVRQKDEQPENAERLMVLIDKDHGVLTAMDEFI